MNTINEITRFLSKVDTINKSKCWIWTGSIWKKTKYGCFTIKRKTFRAHRFSYEFFYGAVPINMFVLHKCDNPTCVNPSHLFIGTHTDNMRDKIKKGRHKQPKGEDHWNCKLDEESIKKIKEMRNSGITMMEISKIYNVHYNTIRFIFNGRRKGHI